MEASIKVKINTRGFIPASIDLLSSSASSLCVTVDPFFKEENYIGYIVGIHGDRSKEPTREIGRVEFHPPKKEQQLYHGEDKPTDLPATLIKAAAKGCDHTVEDSPLDKSMVTCKGKISPFVNEQNRKDLQELILPLPTGVDLNFSISFLNHPFPSLFPIHRLTPTLPYAHPNQTMLFPA